MARRRASAIIDFDQINDLIGESRQNLVACANPESFHEWNYLRPPVVGPWAQGTGGESQRVPENLDSDGSKTAWIKDKDEGFVEGRILNQLEDGQLEVLLAKTTLQIKVPQESVQECNPTCFAYCEDMARLTFLNEASILENLKQRYRVNLLHTYSGLFCITVNPWRKLPVYSPAIVSMYKGRQISEMPPHIFAIADNAYNNMLQEQEDQSILITGESGAGKTENTKKIMNYFAIIAASKQMKGSGASLEQQILETNPVLESFGNAKTVHNDNSSRFGKFTRLLFDQNGKLAGAEIESYLLEKSRVISHCGTDRSYHIFYQLLSDGIPETRELLGLTNSAKDYRYLSQGLESVDTIDDDQDMRHTERGLRILGFSAEERLILFKITAAVTLMGEMKFTQRSAGDQAYTDGLAAPHKVCELLGINMHRFLDALTEPTVTFGDEVVKRSRNLEQVMYSVQAIAMSVYEQAFRWLVKKCNKVLRCSNARKGGKYIGLLDIAGFEIFKLNSFEQLCINLTNEKLQQFFNHHMFVKEQHEYKKEDIPWNYIDFGMDLQPCIDLIEKPMGIFSLLDEECMIPKGNEKALAEKLLHYHLNKTKCFDKPSFKGGTGQQADFSVAHYAGTVNYNVDQWLDKNRDPLSENVIEVFRNCDNHLLKEIWHCYEPTKAQNGSARRRQSLAFLTVASVYKDQLNNLISMLNNTKPQFVRCIVPNYERRPGVIDGNLVLHQLRCNGVLEGIRICRQGYPNRVTYQEFNYRYRILCPGQVHIYLEPKEATGILIKNLDLQVEKDYQMGNTKIFFRAGILGVLEGKRAETLCNIVTAVQSWIRWFLEQKFLSKRKDNHEATLCIQRNVHIWASMLSWRWFQLVKRVKPLREEPKEEMKAELLAAEKDKENLENQLQMTHIEKQTLKTEIGRLAHKTEQILENNRELEQELTLVKEEKMQQEKFLNHMKDHVEEQGRNISGLKSALSQEHSKLQQLQSSNTNMEVTLTQMEFSLDKEKKSRETIEGINNRSKSQLEDLKSKMRSLQQEKVHLEKKLEGKEVESEQLALVMEDQSKKVTALRNLVKELQRKIEELECTLVQEKIMRKRAEHSEKSLLDDVTELRDIAIKTKVVLENQIEQSRQKDEEIWRLQVQLNAVAADNWKEEAIATLRARHASAMEKLQEQIEHLHLKSVRLESENQQLKIQVDDRDRAAERTPAPILSRRKSSASVDLPPLIPHADLHLPLSRKESTSSLHDKKIEDLEKEINQLRCDKRFKQREIDVCKQNLTEETEEKEKLHKQMRTLLDDFDKEKREKNQTSEKLLELQRLQAKNQSEILHLKAKFQTTLSDMELDFELEKKKLISRNKDLSDEIESFHHRVLNSEKAQSDFLLQMHSKEMEIRRLTSMVANLETVQKMEDKALQNWSASFKSAATEVEHLREENSRLQMEIHTLKKEIQMTMMSTSENGLSSPSDSNKSVTPAMDSC